MRFSLLAAAAVAAPVFVFAADLTGRAALSMVPPMPDSAQSAYAQWSSESGNLKPGPAFKKLEDAMSAHMMVQSSAAMAQVPGMNAQAAQQMATAQQMQQQYGSPEAQAKLKSMTPAEAMAMAMSMRPAQPAMTGPVSAHDQALLKKISVYPGVEQVEQQVQSVRNEQIAVDEAWKAERDALDQKKQQEYASIPVCHDEAGEPPSDKVKVLELKYSDQRIALASKYLGKYKLVEQHMRAAVTPRIDFGDEAVVAWSQLQNPGLKQMIGVQAQGAQNAGIADAMNVMGIVQNASQQAALEIVDRKRIEETYKNARGCG